MAQLAELLRDLQPLDGREQKTLYNLARKLREKGLLPKGKRGSGAPELSFEDAANVLIGVVGTSRSVEAVERCRLLGSLKNMECDWYSDELHPELLFKDSLAYLIRDLPKHLKYLAQYITVEEELENEKQGIQRLRDCLRNRGPVNLQVLLRNRSARIEVITSSGKTLWFTEFVSDPKKSAHMKAYKQSGRDKEVTVQFGLMMLLASYHAITDDIGKDMLGAALGMSVPDILNRKHDP